VLRHPIALVLSGTLATVALSAPTALTVTTSAVTNVGTETATGNGDITSLGTDNPTQYGVCWSTSPGPTTSDSKTSEGATSSTGPFTSQITGLAPGVTYYVRAYVTNSSQGTAYGDEQTFTTLTPVATSSGSGLAAIDGDPVVVDAEIVTAGGDVDGYRIIISENLAAGDVLSYTGTLPVGMSASYDATAGTLLFSGTATAAEWQALLRTVTFATTNPTTGTRTITFSAGLALPFADNGHFYEFVSYPSISWGLAKARAELESYFGLAGYLVTVTSAAENDFVVAKLSGEGWMGAHDYASEGEWRWVTGPEGLENSGAGRVFFQQSAAATSSGNLNSVYGGNTPGGGAPVNGEYNAWVPAPVEPNDYGASGEDYAHFLSDGTWNDYPDFTHSISWICCRVRRHAG
jgi:hypothetical protein